MPAVFMTAVDTAFILQAKIGFNLPPDISNIVAVIVAAISLIAFLIMVRPTGDVSEGAEAAE